MHFTNLRAFSIVSACAVLAACTQYTAVPVTPALQEQDVRVQLTQPGMIALATALGAGATQLDGRVVTANDSALTLSVMQLTRLSGVDETWKGEQVTIALRDVSTVEREQRSVARSIVLAAAIGGGAYLLGRSLGGGQATGAQNTVGGPVQ